MGAPPAKRAKGSSGPPQDPQSRLRWAVNLLLGRSITKEDVVFETVEDPSTGTYTSTVGIPEVVPDRGFQGEPGANKKEAEANAAAAALQEQLETQVAPIAEQHEANKKEKQRQRLDALNEKTKAEKAMVS